MRRIPLEQATPGMVLAEDIRLADGNLLLPKATVLTEGHLANLQQRNAGEIAIEPSAQEPDSAQDDARPKVEREALRETARSEVATLFRRAATDPINQALRQAVLEYRLEKIG